MISDLLVVGAGPAGVAATLVATRCGLATTMLTLPEPRRPLIDRAWESLHPGVETVLRRLDALDALRTASVASFRHVVIDGRRTPLSPVSGYDWTSTHVDRAVFDDALARTAIARGANVRQEKVVAVTVSADRLTGVRTDKNRTYRADCIVDASGRRRVIARALSLLRRTDSPPLRVSTGVITGGPSRTETSFHARPDGWVWITSASGVRRTWTRLQRSTRGRPHPPPELASAATLGRVRAFDATWYVARPLGGPGYLLAGDAAAMIDPATGQGVLSALHSGAMAGWTASQISRCSDLEAMYVATYDQWLLDRHDALASRLRAHYEGSGIRVLDR